MNGGILGTLNKSKSGLWTPNDVFLGTNFIRSGLPLNAVVWDTLDSVTGRTVENGTHTANTTTFLDGLGSMNLLKTSTSQGYAMSYKTGITSIDMSGKMIGVAVYIKDAATLAKISDIQLCLGQSKTARYYYKFAPAVLRVGWNILEMNTGTPSSTEGAPSITAVTYNSVTLVVTSNATTTTTGDVVFDAIYYRTAV